MSGKLKFLLTLLGISAIFLPVVLAIVSGNLRQRPEIESSIKKQELRFEIPEEPKSTESAKTATESLKLATSSVRPATESGR